MWLGARTTVIAGSTAAAIVAALGAERFNRRPSALPVVSDSGARQRAKNSLPVDADRRRQRCFIGTAFGEFIEMEPLVRSDEWNSLKEQFALLVRTEGARTDEVEELLDVQFQRRVAELIEQAAGPDHSHRLR
jgi:hypothetical protein